MKDFSSLLKRIYGSLNKDSIERENILFTLKNATGAALTSSNIFVRDGVIEITATPVIKNEIKLKEQTILNSLKTNYNLSYSRVLYK